MDRRRQGKSATKKEKVDGEAYYLVRNFLLSIMSVNIRGEYAKSNKRTIYSY